MTLRDDLNKIANTRYSLNMFGTESEHDKVRDRDYDRVVVYGTCISKDDYGSRILVAVDAIPVLTFLPLGHGNTLDWKMHSPALEAHVTAAVGIVVTRILERERADRERELDRDRKETARLAAFKARFGIEGVAEPQIQPMGAELQALDERLRTYTKRHPGA